MCARGTVACFYLLIYVVYCSSIFTRSMIRLPDNPSGTDISKNASLEPMILTSKSDDKRYEIIYPAKLVSQSVHDDESDSLIDEERTESHKGTSPNDEFQTKSPSSYSKTSSVHLKQLQSSTEHPDYSMMNTSEILENIDNDKSHLKNNQKPIKESEDSEDWKLKAEQNFLPNFYDNLGLLGTNGFSPDTEKSFRGLNLWIAIQRFLNCGWSSRWMSCIHESFSATSDNVDDDSVFLPNFMVPRIPSTDMDEESSEVEEERFDMESPDHDEARKRLSKKLMSLLPILLMIKMSMVPALAIMALVSGKAFLMSLLSLGVALFSTLLGPKDSFLSASKRHEIPAQSPISPDQNPSNYYYMM